MPRPRKRVVKAWKFAKHAARGVTISAVAVGMIKAGVDARQPRHMAAARQERPYVAQSHSRATTAKSDAAGGAAIALKAEEKPAAKPPSLKSESGLESETNPNLPKRNILAKAKAAKRQRG